MLILIAMILGMDAQAVTPPKDMNKWTACQRDNDCMVLKDACGSSVCLNAKYSDAAKKHYEAIAPEIRCPAPGKEEVLVPSCMRSVCTCAGYGKWKDPAASELAKWKSCEKDEHCVAMLNIHECVYLPVNRRYQGAMASYLFEKEQREARNRTPEQMQAKANEALNAGKCDPKKPEVRCKAGKCQ